MISFLEELEAFSGRFQIPRSAFCIIGDSAFADKGLGINHCIEICMKDKKFYFKRILRESKLFPHIVIASHKYQKFIGLSDKEILNNPFFTYQKQGFKIIRPEIEFAFRIYRKIHDDCNNLSLIHEYLLDKANNWDWDLFKRFSKERVDAIKYKKLIFDQDNVLSLLEKGVKNPRKGFQFIDAKIKDFFFYRKKVKGLQSQVISKMHTAAILGMHFYKGEFFRYDILMRYKAVQSILCGEEAFLDYYKRMQNIAWGVKTLNRLEALIYSIKDKGYFERSPIVISRSTFYDSFFRLVNGHVIDGAHRLACALYFGIKELPVEIVSREGGKKFGKQWFLDHGFALKVMEELDQTKHQLFFQHGIYFPVIIWPPAIKFCDQISRYIRSRHKVFFEKKVFLGEDFNNFLFSIYESDYTDKWKISLKAHLMRKYAPEVYVMIIEVPDPKFQMKDRRKLYLSDVTINLKESIRKKFKHLIEDYVNDMIIHTGDNYIQNKESIRILEKYVLIFK